jgi:hypothetical protein
MRSTIVRVAQAPARGRSRLRDADHLTLEHVRRRDDRISSGLEAGIGGVLCHPLFVCFRDGTVLAADGDLEGVSKFSEI